MLYAICKLERALFSSFIIGDKPQPLLQLIISITVSRNNLGPLIKQDLIDITHLHSPVYGANHAVARL